MATKSATRLLAEHGFSLERQGTHGEMWTDGVSRIMVSRNAEDGHPGLRKDLRNAMKKRRPAEPVPQEEPVKDPFREQVHEPVQKDKPQSTKGPRQLPLLVMTILTDPDLTSDQKVKMIMAYAELS